MQDLWHVFQTQLQSWAVLDWLIAAWLAISTFSAFFRGFIASLISLLGMCAGIFAALVYGPRTAPTLLTWIGSLLIARLAAFLLILAAVYLAVTLVGRLLRGICRAIGLGVFGLVRGTLLLAALTLPLKPYLVHFAGDRPSLLLPYLLELSHGIFSVVPQHTRQHLFIDHLGL